jgi:hypothetical protein
MLIDAPTHVPIDKSSEGVSEQQVVALQDAPELKETQEPDPVDSEEAVAPESEQDANVEPTPAKDLKALHVEGTFNFVIFGL